MRAVKSVSIDSERRVIITFLDGSTETLYPNSIWGNAEALKKIFEELLEEKADVVEQTINNTAIASFVDGADDALIRKLLVSIEPIQEGTGDPSPENIRAISGKTGCYVAHAAVTYPMEQGSIGDSDGAETAYPTRVRTADYIPYSGETLLCIYCAKSQPSDRIRRIYWYNSEKTFISSNTIGASAAELPAIYSNFTPPENAAYYRIVLQKATTTDRISPDGREIVINPVTVSINWQTEAGTVYDGTLDVVTGKLIVNKKLCEISDLTYTYNSQYGRFETSSLSSIIKLPPNNITRLEGLISSIYTIGLPSNTGSNPINNTIAVVSGGGVYIRDERYNNVSDFISGVGDQTICYPLAEPIEYQLTPQEVRTLLGENNIWSDGGDISVEYPADTKTYIDAFSIKTVEVSGQTPTITAEENTRYICGEVTSLTFTPCESGICDVRFTAASISTVLSLPQTLKLPDWFDPTSLEANTTYEINVVDGVYGAVMSWA